MPFTPFHLGPALAIGLPMRKWIHLPTFILANIIIDIEPLVVILLGLSYPLHGYLHTFIGALITGALLGIIMYRVEKRLGYIWRKLFLETETNPDLRMFVTAGISGTLLHVLLDSPLYNDIKPLYPLDINPFYNPDLTAIIYGACILMGITGIIYYIYIVIKCSSSLNS